MNDFGYIHNTVLYENICQASLKFFKITLPINKGYGKAIKQKHGEKSELNMVKYQFHIKDNLSSFSTDQ